MRTNIDIDEALLAEAMAALNLTTKRATVEQALREVVELRRRRQAIKDMAGLGWDGDLNAMRADNIKPNYSNSYVHPGAIRPSP